MTNPLAAITAALVVMLGHPTEAPVQRTRTELLEAQVSELERDNQRARREARVWRKRFRAARRAMRQEPERVCCKSIVHLGHRLIRFGFQVGEHTAFGGVAPVHRGLAHYEDRALDVNYGPPGASTTERVRLAWLVGELRAVPCVTGVLHPGNDAGHADHLHLEWGCA